MWKTIENKILNPYADILIKHILLTIFAGFLIVLMAGLFIPKQFDHACFLAEMLVMPAVCARGIVKKINVTTLILQILLMEAAQGTFAFIVNMLWVHQ